MGVLPSAAASYGMDVITPAVIERPDKSSFPTSKSLCPLWEYREDREPLVLLEALGTCSTEPPSSWPEESGVRSLCIFLPKNDLPPDDCLVLLSTGGVVEGISRINIPYPVVSPSRT